MNDKKIKLQQQKNLMRNIICMVKIKLFCTLNLIILISYATPPEIKTMQKIEFNLREIRDMNLEEAKKLSLENYTLGLNTLTENGGTGMRKLLEKNGTIVDQLKLDFGDSFVVSRATYGIGEDGFLEGKWEQHSFIANVVDVNPMKIKLYDLNGDNKDNVRVTKFAEIKGLGSNISDWDKSNNILDPNINKTGLYLRTKQVEDGDEIFGSYMEKLNKFTLEGSVYKINLDDEVIGKGFLNVIEKLKENNTGYYKYLYNCNTFIYDVLEESLKIKSALMEKEAVNGDSGASLNQGSNPNELKTADAKISEDATGNAINKAGTNLHENEKVEGEKVETGVKEEKPKLEEDDLVGE